MSSLLISPEIAVNPGAGSLLLGPADTHVAPVLERHARCAEIREFGYRDDFVTGLLEFLGLVLESQATDRVPAVSGAEALVAVVEEGACGLAAKSYVCNSFSVSVAHLCAMVVGCMDDCRVFPGLGFLMTALREIRVQMFGVFSLVWWGCFLVIVSTVFHVVCLCNK